MVKEPVKVKERKAAQRAADFGEVVLGYDEKEALREAGRCLQCKNPSCVSGCPVGIDIKSFIYCIAKKDYAGAYLKIRQKNHFPSLCGRVCPAEYQCAKSCVLTKQGSIFASEDAIRIHFLERFAGDYGMKHLPEAGVVIDKRLSKFKAAVVGAGPAGLCCAGELARHGVKVTVFEGLHKAGGVLRYGIPPFRLPQDILDAEINYLTGLGVQFVFNTVVGRTKTIDDLFQEGYAAIFLGLGAGTPAFLGVSGENLGNIYSANEFLTRVNLMGAYKFPEYHTPVNAGRHIIVIGGGNTAMDAARVALRMQCLKGYRPDVTVAYRRTELEMPARRLEIEHARQEGIRFVFLVQPKEFVADERGMVKSARFLKCELGEPDASGRRRPQAVEGSDFDAPCDTAVIAVGLFANRLLTGVTAGLGTDKHGDIKVTPETMETLIPGVFAGGDIVGGEGTMIAAMGMAKRAAAAIIARLKNLDN